MKEFFFILLVIAVLLAFTAFRYRKQIAAVYKIWTLLRGGQGGGSIGRMNEAADIEKGPLVNCAKCGDWVPETTAIRLGTRVFYCSSACLEKAATTA